ncbi:hypothetical protein VP01_410g1 [Puccinia sorghi]|uniref:Uncharacterized protein n=1 Tax=Puccinia sorghi TaxID=27349 RepID=A0A0L6UT61_9BASI|nr:hypothetical protein VP01_410g1 [Puccinia sorghi]
MSDLKILKSDQTIALKTTTTDSTGTMEKLDLIYLKLAINADSQLFQHTKNQGLLLEGKGAISEDDARNVRTILTAKIDASVHANVITHLNKDNTLLIWKAIINFFASQHAANRARAWNHFSYLSFNQSDIAGFITNVKSAIEKLHEVGINCDVDIIAYEIVKKLPKTPEYNGISTAITHSGSAITPDNRRFLQSQSNTTSLPFYQSFSKVS